MLYGELVGTDRSGVGQFGEHSLWAEESGDAPLFRDKYSVED